MTLDTERDSDEFVPCPRHGTHCYPEIPDLAQRIECAIGLGDGGAQGVRATRDRIMMMIEDHDAERATERTSDVDVTTSEPNAALYFACQNHHPLALRTTTAIENGVRRAVRYEPVCPQCERDGITEVQLPDEDEANGA